MVQHNTQIKPFLPSRPSGPLFIGLNILRLISIVALILVFSSNIVTMANDIKAIRSHQEIQDIECEYFEWSSVPDQVGGPFWSILNRLFIIFECILLVLSEIGIPRVFFEQYLPILGSGHGLGCLGVFQALIGAQVLSHYCDLFPQASAWFLFIIGGFNLIAGVLLGQRAKEGRLIFSWENVSSLTPQTRMAATAWDMIPSTSIKRSQGGSNLSETSISVSPSKLSLEPLPRSMGNTTFPQSPLLPKGLAPTMADRFGQMSRGFGFGKQGEKQAGEKGWKISKPAESLPKYAV